MLAAFAEILLILQQKYLLVIYPANFESKIGFDFIRKSIEARCISPLGVAECQAMGFSHNYEEVVRMLGETNEFLSILQDRVDFPIDNFSDLTRELKDIRIEGTYLNENNLFNLKRSLVTISGIVSFFSKHNNDSSTPYPLLTELTASMHGFPDIIKTIDSVLDKFGYIKDNASPLLSDIKKSIASKISGINGMLRRILSEGRQSGIIEKDATPTVRDGRLVIPVAPMYKRKVRGIVHDESATGKTVFIEPAEIVEANNSVRELEIEMRREIIRILTVTADYIRPHIEDLLNTYRIFGKIDFIRAKALFAGDLGCKLPNIERIPQIDWYNAVHPVLFMSLREQNKKVVPLNITLDNKNRILLISGPNAGGKSVCLKTVGIVQYMTQCGLLPPLYENSHVGIFKKLYIDIGDEQSLEDDLSTYSSHLTNMKNFINNGDENTLVLIDEFGGGTEPQIGGAIAQAILNRLNQKEIFGVITTHYQNLKHFAEDTPGIINGAMLYDRHKMQPLFQLSIGYPGSSFAIEIARKIGLPQQVISEAENIVGSDYVNMDKYLLDIARDKKYWESKRHDIRQKEKRLESLMEKYNAGIESLEREHKEIIRAAKAEAKEILAQSNASIERTIHEIKKAQAEKERTKKLRKELDEFKASLAEDSTPGIGIKHPKQKNKKQNKETNRQEVTANNNDTIKVNDFVTLDNNGVVGQVISIEGKNATVTFGNIKTNVKLLRLKKANKPVSTQKDISFIAATTSDEIRKKQLEFKQDIDVRGMRADEAIQAVTYFLDDAIQFNVGQVRILHGTGTGALRQRLREYIDTVKGVKSYRDEHVQFGGAGITIVELY